MTTIQPQKIGSHLNDALQIISDAAQLYPDSRNLARHHAELLAQCGRGREALDACETFMVKFGVDDDLLALALQLRQQAGVFDRLAKAGKHSISLCMIVKNEEKNLPACLASLKPVVDEMIVVDTGSTDRTVGIASAFGAKVSTFAWNGNFSDARNCAINNARGKWILVMDADEVLSLKDYDAIRRAVCQSKNGTTVWSVLTRNYTTRVNAQGWTPNDHAYPAEERADGWHPSWKVRLFPNNQRIRFTGEVHEMLEGTLRQSGFSICPADFVVHHYGGLNDVKNREKMLHYYELGRNKLKECPDNYAALQELATQAGELELYDEAIALWHKVLAFDTTSKEALFNLSYAFMGLKQYQSGLAAARVAVSIDPEYKEAAFNFGTCSLYAGNPHEALALLTPLSARCPDYPPLLAILTALNLATGNLTAAQEAYFKLKEKNYSVSDYLRDRATTLDIQGRADMAAQLREGANNLGMRLE